MQFSRAPADGPVRETLLNTPVGSFPVKYRVVDDEAIITATVRRLLSREHDVTTATRAIEGLHRIQSGERFDLILCDLMMPQMTGMELYDRIQGIDAEQAGRIVFLTGGAFTPTARQFLNEARCDSLNKPFAKQELLAHVTALLAS